MNQFQLLLLFIATRMRFLSANHAGFMALLYNRKFVIQFQTAGGEVIRYFSVKNGHVYSRAKAHSKPDFTLTFADAEYAVKTLSKGSPMAFMKGMQEGKIKMEGDFSLLMWFNNAAKYLQPKVPRPIRRAAKWIKTQQARVKEQREAGKSA